ncbi:cyclase family protein [Rhizomonospora bruguierae]|uniref:cyclase family protein n=1 Tax=Rhizomonospora bruguierae TaxID=1581705 RepID=UPI001BCF0F5C|nr:cyclase family protein [Micromonospora sp. NBRC 107566]
MTNHEPAGGADALVEVVGQGVRVIDLGRPYAVGMPKSPNHAAYTHTLQRRHGDVVRADGGSAANDLIVLGTHVGTHIDALAHISHNGLLHGGHDAAAEQIGGRFERGGVQDFAPFVGRAVLLDIPGLLGVAACPAAYAVTANDLAAAAARQRTRIGAGDVVLVRTGWGSHWDDHDRYIGAATGVPGPDADAAEWLAGREVRAAGSDTIAFEHIPAGVGHASLPVHRILLVDNGINIIETLDLDRLAAERVYEFVLVLSPLHLTGATGAPVRPLALTSAR